jgi:hypothetical protein
MIGHWFDLGFEDWITKLKKSEVTKGRHIYFFENWVTRGDKVQCQSVAIFMPRGSTAKHPALAGFVYDTDYLKDKFFSASVERSVDKSKPKRYLPFPTGDDGTDCEGPRSFGCVALLGWRVA